MYRSKVQHGNTRAFSANYQHLPSDKLQVGRPHEVHNFKTSANASPEDQVTKSTCAKHSLQNEKLSLLHRDTQSRGLDRLSTSTRERHAGKRTAPIHLVQPSPALVMKRTHSTECSLLQHQISPVTTGRYFTILEFRCTIRVCSQDAEQARRPSMDIMPSPCATTLAHHLQD